MQKDSRILSKRPSSFDNLISYSNSNSYSNVDESNCNVITESCPNYIDNISNQSHKIGMRYDISNSNSMHPIVHLKTNISHMYSGFDSDLPVYNSIPSILYVLEIPEVWYINPSEIKVCFNMHVLVYIYEYGVFVLLFYLYFHEFYIYIYIYIGKFI